MYNYIDGYANVIRSRSVYSQSAWRSMPIGSDHSDENSIVIKKLNIFSFKLFKYPRVQHIFIFIHLSKLHTYTRTMAPFILNWGNISIGGTLCPWPSRRPSLSQHQGRQPQDCCCRLLLRPVCSSIHWQSQGKPWGETMGLGSEKWCSRRCQGERHLQRSV